MTRSSFLPLFSIVIAAAVFQGSNGQWDYSSAATGFPWATEGPITGGASQPPATAGRTWAPTQPPPVTTTRESGPPALHYPAQCACTPNKIWLDVVVVMEVSASMTSPGLNQAKALIAPLIAALPLNQNVQMTSRVGIVYFSSTATVQAQLNVYGSPDQAQAGIYAIPFSGDAGVDLEAGLQTAAGIFTRSARPYTKSMIIFITSSNQNGQFLDPKPVADQLKSEGITIVTIAFAQTDESNPPDVQFASPGYNFTNKDPNMNQRILGALCETNCFCPSNWFQFGDNIVKKYGECVYPGDFPTTWTAAQTACLNTRGGYLADELSTNKQSFLKDMATRLFSSANPFAYWVGLTYQNGRTVWDHNNGGSFALSGGDYINWAPGNGFPSAAGSCVAEMTYLSFSTRWYAKECSSPFTATFNYFCQRSACDTDTWCY